MKILAPITDIKLDLHSPKFYDSIFWQYGYIDTTFKPIARKCRLTGTITLRYWNDLFSCWEWTELNEKYVKKFKKL
jgi:hypothetical protein